jgi:2-keto-3-deoxy-L-rhamnonate aldolase RhmA
MKGHELCAALHAGRQLYGTLIISPSPRWVPVVRQAGLDFIFIDTEHIALDRAQVSWMCQTYAALGLAPVVRIPSPDPYEAVKILDGGAVGIIAPYIETPEQVQALRGAIKHRPLKGAKLDGILAGQPCEPELAAYIQQRCADNVLIVNIESVPAIQALDDILKVPGLDGVLIGPHDLSCSLGVPEQYTHPRFIEAAHTIFRKARAAGVGAGVHYWGDLEAEASLVRTGANFLIHSSDLVLFAKHLGQELGALRKLVGKSPESSVSAGGAINI